MLNTHFTLMVISNLRNKSLLTDMEKVWHVWQTRVPSRALFRWNTVYGNTLILISWIIYGDTLILNFMNMKRLGGRPDARASGRGWPGCKSEARRYASGIIWSLNFVVWWIHWHIDIILHQGREARVRGRQGPSKGGLLRRLPRVQRDLVHHQRAWCGSCSFTTGTSLLNCSHLALGEALQGGHDLIDLCTSCFWNRALLNACSVLFWVRW